MTLTPEQVARANRAMRCYETHKIKRTISAALPRVIVPSHPVGFIPRRYVWELYRSGIASLWSTGGRVHDSKGIVEFR